jgi:2-dehydro-3-deoxyphosphogalactonate aldolase
LVAVLRGLTPAEAPAIGEALFEGGFTCAEVTLDSPEPLKAIAALRARMDGRLLVGAGTVVAAEAVRAAAHAGAQFIVSPNTDPAVIAATKSAGLASLPGVFTPTEALSALAAGADALKFFPAEMASPAALRALRTILPPGARVLPVGGITPGSLAGWRAAGAAGAGVGSALYRAGSSPVEVRARAAEFAAAWRAAI